MKQYLFDDTSSSCLVYYIEVCKYPALRRQSTITHHVFMSNRDTSLHSPRTLDKPCEKNVGSLSIFRIIYKYIYIQYTYTEATTSSALVDYTVTQEKPIRHTALGSRIVHPHNLWNHLILDVNGLARRAFDIASINSIRTRRRRISNTHTHTYCIYTKSARPIVEFDVSF